LGAGLPRARVRAFYFYVSQAFSSIFRNLLIILQIFLGPLSQACRKPDGSVPVSCGCFLWFFALVQHAGLVREYRGSELIPLN
jgi:hypothetical protein